MIRVVLDASAGVESVLQSEIGTRVERAVAAAELWVPEHFYVETAATIRRLQLASPLDANLANAPTLGVDTLVP